MMSPPQLQIFNVVSLSRQVRHFNMPGHHFSTIQLRTVDVDGQEVSIELFFRGDPVTEETLPPLYFGETGEAR
jgi:hypothetical protein